MRPEDTLSYYKRTRPAPKEPQPVKLDCGHIEIRKGHCATTDCPRFVDRVDVRLR
jgi:hypothetical protein